MGTLPGLVSAVHHHLTGETNIIFAAGLSSNKYFGCWAQTCSDLDLLQLSPAMVSSVWMGKNNNKLVFLFLRILNKKWGGGGGILWKREKHRSDLNFSGSNWRWSGVVTWLRHCYAVSMFCGCSKRGRASPPPIVTRHLASDMLRSRSTCSLIKSPGMLWVGTLTCIMRSVTSAESEIAWRGQRRQEPPLPGWWLVTTLQHRNRVSKNQSPQQSTSCIIKLIKLMVILYK